MQTGGTEVFNDLDYNLAVQAYMTKPLSKQVLPYDENDGSGFWWANSHNIFTRNTGAAVTATKAHNAKQRWSSVITEVRGAF